MKKLMIAAVAAAVASGAFALPHVYDYKASVKHLYLKEVTVSYKDADGKSKKDVVYQKYQVTTPLKGYLVMDNDGATSPTINDETFKEANIGNGFDYGRNRGFLVVYNSKAYKDVRHAKILPAVLDAKWLDTAFGKKGAATSGLAEGTLYVGGDAVAPVRVQHDYIYEYGNKDDVKSRAAAPIPPAAATPGMAAIADYVWTSVYLFAGSKEVDAYYNGPNWFKIDQGKDQDDKQLYSSPFGHFEFAWDQNLPEWLRTGWAKVGNDGENYGKEPVNYYHDTWMNGAGVGKWFSRDGKTTTEYCCGIEDEEIDSGDAKTLDTLAGNLKGGLFLCTENGILARSKTYDWFLNIEWEDQFNTARLVGDKVVFFVGDAWENDLWQDGFVEQETTDVIYGTWSIKFNKNFFDAKKGKAKDLPIYNLGGLRPTSFEEYWADISFGAKNTKLETLWKTIYGAAYDLDKGVTLYDGTEIYSKTVKNRADLPMITPQFAKYYRLTVTAQ